jgi:hypothetical protein
MQPTDAASAATEVCKVCAQAGGSVRVVTLNPLELKMITMPNQHHFGEERCAAPRTMDTERKKERKKKKTEKKNKSDREFASSRHTHTVSLNVIGKGSGKP